MRLVIIQTTQNLDLKYSNNAICKKIIIVISNFNSLNLLQIYFKALQNLKANGEKVNKIKTEITQRTMNKNCFVMNQDI
jgi:hypothetical protein